MGRIVDGSGYRLLTSISLLILPMLVIAGIFVPSFDSAEDGSWPVVTGDHRNTHRSDSMIIYTEPRIEYLDFLGESRAVSYHQPVISPSDDLYITSNGSLMSYDSDGELSWSVNLVNGTDEEISGPAVTPDGGIVVFDSYGYLHKFDRDGSNVWSSPVFEGRGPCTSLYPVTTDDRVYMTGPGTRLSCFDLDGGEIWNRSLPGSWLSMPAVANDGSIAFTFTGLESGIIVLNKSGDEAWRNGSFVSPVSDPVIDDEGGLAVVIRDVGGGCALLKFHINGSLDWSADLACTDSDDFSLSLDGDGNILASCGLGVIQMFDLSGSELWNITLKGDITAPCTTTGDGYVLVPTGAWMIVINSSGEKAGEVYTGVLIGSVSLNSTGVGYGASEYLVRVKFSDEPAGSQRGWAPDLIFEEDGEILIEMRDVFEGPPSTETKYMLVSDDEGLHFSMADSHTMRIRGSSDFNGIAGARLTASTAGKDGLLNTSDDISTLSNRFEVNIIPVNDPPVLLNGEDLPDAVAGEEYIYDLVLEDIDSDIDYLTLSLEGIDWMGVKGHTLYSDTTDQASRYNDFKLDIYDSEGGGSRYYLNVLLAEFNTAPYVDDYDIDNLREDGTLNILVRTMAPSYQGNQIYVVDDEGDAITFEVDPGPGLDIVQQLSLSFTIAPKDDFFGDTSFDLILSDGKLESRRTFSVYVRPEADNVRDLSIELETPPADLRSDRSIVMVSAFTDPDDGSQYYGNYDFYWFSDIDGEIGYGTRIEVILSPGNHNISLVANKYHMYLDDVEAYLELEVASGSESDGEVHYEEIDSKEVLKQVLMIISLILLTFTVIPLLFIGGQTLWNKYHGGSSTDLPEDVVPQFKLIDDDGGGPP